MREDAPGVDRRGRGGRDIADGHRAGGGSDCRSRDPVGGTPDGHVAVVVRDHARRRAHVGDGHRRARCRVVVLRLVSARAADRARDDYGGRCRVLTRRPAPAPRRAASALGGGDRARHRRGILDHRGGVPLRALARGARSGGLHQRRTHDRRHAPDGSENERRTVRQPRRVHTGLTERRCRERSRRRRVLPHASRVARGRLLARGRHRHAARARDPRRTRPPRVVRARRHASSGRAGRCSRPACW